MPNPKRKHSKSRTGKRRAHDHLTPAAVGHCPHCGEPRPPQTALRRMRPGRVGQCEPRADRIGRPRNHDSVDGRLEPRDRAARRARDDPQLPLGRSFL